MINETKIEILNEKSIENNDDDKQIAKSLIINENEFNKTGAFNQDSFQTSLSKTNQQFFNAFNKLKNNSIASMSLINNNSSSTTNDTNASSKFFICKICFNKFNDINLNSNDKLGRLYQIQSCKCVFCVNCLFHYIKQCIENCDVLPIYCPDPKCLMKGSLDQQEIKQILLTNKLLLDENNNKNIFNNNTKICYIDCEVINEKDNLIKSETESDSSDYLYKRYLKLYENIEILRDPNKTHCPNPECQNVCIISVELKTNKTSDLNKQSGKRTTTTTLNENTSQNNIKVTCRKCNNEFCSICFKRWVDLDASINFVDEKSILNKSSNKLLAHNEKNKKKAEINKSTNETIDSCDCNAFNVYDNENDGENFINSKGLFNNFENIKRCPKCSVLIERADGCAQIMCKVCKHTFCFYCLASLDNDFLLKHFTKNGPCKGKLGHSRLSIFMHRIGVVAIFSGTILLIILLSPILLLSLPCLIFSNKCRKTCYKFSTKFS